MRLELKTHEVPELVRLRREGKTIAQLRQILGYGEEICRRELVRFPDATEDFWRTRSAKLREGR